MEEKIKEINLHISNALKQWAEICLASEDDNWAYHLEYSDEDITNALLIFMHVASNKAIKSGHITELNAEELMYKFCKTIKETFGFNTVELVNKTMGKNGIEDI